MPAKSTGRTTPKKVIDPIEKAISEILAGRWDHQVKNLLMALAMRADAAGVMWKLEWDGYTMTEADITVDEAEQIERALGVSFAEASPATSIIFARAALHVLLVERKGMDPDEARKVIGKAKAVDLSRAVGVTQQLEPRPFDSATTESGQ